MMGSDLHIYTYTHTPPTHIHTNKCNKNYVAFLKTESHCVALTDQKLTM